MKFKNLALFYVQLILDGKCTYSDVPKRLKLYVKQVAIDLEAYGKILKGTLRSILLHLQMQTKSN